MFATGHAREREREREGERERERERESMNDTQWHIKSHQFSYQPNLSNLISAVKSRELK